VEHLAEDEIWQVKSKGEKACALLRQALKQARNLNAATRLMTSAWKWKVS